MHLIAPQRHLSAKGFLACALAIDILLIFAIDMYAPALPGMQREFGVTEAVLNLTMFAYFLFSAIGVVLAGPLSDRLGRKPVLLGSCVLFTAASVGCALSPNVAVLVVFRVGEALAFGAVSTLETALVKDAFGEEDLKLAMTLLQSIVIIGPVAAPFFGSFVLVLFAWRAIFWTFAIFGVVSVVLALLISETLPACNRTTGGVMQSLAQTARHGRTLLKKPGFPQAMLFLGAVGMPFFAFIATVSYILLDEFAVGYMGYNLVYAAACAINAVAPFVYLGLSKRLQPRTIFIVVIALTAASCALMALCGQASPALFFIAFAPYALGEGVARPLCFMLLLDQQPEQVGAASSLSNLSYTVLTAISTVFATLAWSSFITGLTVIIGAVAGVLLVLFALMCVSHAKLARAGE